LILCLLSFLLFQVKIYLPAKIILILILLSSISLAFPFINNQRVSKIYSTKKATIPALSINTIEVEGDLNQAIYSIEEYWQDTPAKSVIAIATSPVPIKISAESNMIIQANTQGRTIAAISENSKMPHIAAMGRLSPDKEEILEQEIQDLLKRGPMVRIDETLDQLGKAKYFSKLDMVEGYYQIPLPMGFKNAGAAFQRQMDTVLGRAYRPSKTNIR
jgi:hypothetical protein